MSDTRAAVDEALQRLVEAVETALEQTNAAGAAAFGKGEYDGAQRNLEEASLLRALRQQVKLLQQEWLEFRYAGVAGGLLLLPGRARQNRLRPGERTPELTYLRPVLLAVAEMGGSAPSSAVLLRVEELLRDELKPVDYLATRSNPRVPRWRVTAQRARNRLAEQGLMRRDSPRGQWEITPAGRLVLRDPEWPGEVDATIGGDSHRG